MTDLTDLLSGPDGAELLFGLVLILWGVAWLIARHVNQCRWIRRQPSQRAAHVRHDERHDEPCTHPAWRVERLAYTGAGQALRISCFRCGASALDRFTSHALADGTISIVNATRDVQLVVIAGELHEMLPPQQWSPYEDDVAESTYAIYLQPPAPSDAPYLRKL